MASVAIQMV